LQKLCDHSGTKVGVGVSLSEVDPAWRQADGITSSFGNGQHAGGYHYFWRRLCVIACEDVGPADDTLAAFVVACATLFSPKKTGGENYSLLCSLAEQMCDLSTRSRIYCSYGVIEPVASKSELPELLVEDRPIVSAIMQRKAAVQVA
jgi:hypothetical protein